MKLTALIHAAKTDTEIELTSAEVNSTLYT